MTDRATIEPFFDTNTGTVSYVVADPATRCAAVIDPVLDYDFKSGHTDSKSAGRILEYLKNKNMPAWEVPNMLTKYYTTTKALEVASSTK